MINEIMNDFLDITNFIFAGNTEELQKLFLLYFRNHHDKILFSTNSSTYGVSFGDNVIRFKPNDSGLFNFITKLYLSDRPFDLFLLTGSFYSNGEIRNEGFEQVDSAKNLINECLSTEGKSISPGPLSFDTMSVQNASSIFFHLKTDAYYASNYLYVLNQQYIQNPNVLNDATFIQKYRANGLAFKISEHALTKYENNKLLVSQTALPSIDKFLNYLNHIDLTKKKSIIVYIAYAEFPILLSKLVSKINPNTLEKLRGYITIILTSIHNCDYYTWDLFKDTKTDKLWYNTGKTWSDILDIFNVRVNILRSDQSLGILYDLLNERMRMISGIQLNTSLINRNQVEPIYNALNFMYYHLKNNISLPSFRLRHFLNKKLFNFQNNLVFNSHMDNIYGLYTATSFFYDGDENINTNDLKNVSEPCSGSTVIITGSSDNNVKKKYCVNTHMNSCGKSWKALDGSISGSCYRCDASLCKTDIRSSV
jgi:hypothetical protein